MKKYQKHAIAGDTQATLRYAIFLAAFILSEILFYFGYRQFSARFVVGCTKLLRDMTLGAVSQLITTLISYLSYFVVLICATWLVLQGDFSAGNFFVAIGMIDQLSYPLIELVREIRYRNVSFAYPDEKPVLENFSFQAQKGRRYLIKGPSGCGKTTAINLLLRYYDPNLPNLLYIGHLTYLWNPYKINVFGLFSFTFICIIDIIIFSDYTYVWGNRRGISGIFEKQKWYYIRV